MNKLGNTVNSDVIAEYQYPIPIKTSAQLQQAYTYGTN